MSATMPIICLDPGHNKTGPDAGAQGNGLFEQDLTLDIARRLRPLLQFNGFQVIMTRDGDFANGDNSSQNASLKTRCSIANVAKADLFISIHINAGGGTGSEVYALPGGKAEAVAGKVLKYLISACGWANRGVKTNRNFYVLAYTAMPAILSENGFIDNPNDAAKLKDPNFRQAIAVAHAQGICEFYGISYQEATQPSPSAPTQAPAQAPIQTPVQTNMLDTLVVYANPFDEHAAHYLQDYLNCPSIALEDLTQATVDITEDIYGVGGTQRQYAVSGKPIPLRQLITGNGRNDTAAKVLEFIQSGKH